MGQIVYKKQQDNNTAFIHPLPGASGYSLRRKNILSVYTKNDIISLKFAPSMTGLQLTQEIYQKTGKKYSFYINNNMLKMESSLAEQGISEKSLVRAEETNKFNESYRKLSICNSNKSTVISHRRTESAQICEQINFDADLSIYAAPEVGKLSNKRDIDKKPMRMKTPSNKYCYKLY